MSDLTDAIDGLNQAAVNANNTTTFFDDVTTLGDTATVTNPNNKLTVPSVQKQVKDLVDGLVDIPPLDSVAEIPSITGYSIGDKVQWLGYYSASDGGSNWGIIKEGAHTEDGGSVFTIDGDFYVEANLKGRSIGVNKFGVLISNSDNYERMQACADYASSQSISLNQVVAVKVQDGDFFLSDQVVFNVLRGDGPRGISLTGASINSTRWVATDDNTSGLIKMTSTGNIELWTVSKMSFVSPLDYDSTANNGVALHVMSTLDKDTAGFGEQPNRTVIISKVFIGPYADSITSINNGSIGNFSKGIFIENKWWPEIDTVYIRGGEDTLLSEMSGRSHAIHCYNCYSPEISKLQVTGFYEYGVLLEMFNDEDFRFQDSFLVGQYIGFSLTHPDSDADVTYEPGGAISNCHVNSHKNGLHLKYHRQANINGCYFYVPRGNKLNQGETGTPSSIWLEGTGDIKINDNQFLETGFFVDDDNTSVGVLCTYKADGVSISDNHFNCGGTGVYISSDVDDGVLITGSTYDGVSLWGSVVNKVTDYSGLAVNSDWWNIDTIGQATRTTESKCAVGSGSPIRDIIKSTREDYATKSNSGIYEKRYQGLMSDGEVGQIAEVFSFDDNDATDPSLVKTTYITGTSGLQEVQETKIPINDLDTSFKLAWMDGTTIRTRQVTLGAADSGGAGKRALIVNN